MVYLPLKKGNYPVENAEEKKMDGARPGCSPIRIVLDRVGAEPSSF
jgi:hypothetical protein